MILIKKNSQAQSSVIRAPSPCQTWLSAAETTQWSSFYALSLSLVVLPSQRPTKILEQSSLSLLQKPPTFRYRYLKRYDEPSHANHTILSSSASSTIWYVFYLSPAPPHEFLRAAESRFYTKKVDFLELISQKMICQTSWFWAHLKEEAKLSKMKYFLLPNSS
jgi:hypothetical protein